MRMIQIHSQNSKSSAPGYCFEVSIPERGVAVLCSFVTRGRFSHEVQNWANAVSHEMQSLALRSQLRR